ncbi:phosphomannomutase [Pseudodesulfovibrio cashew]|uniref:Phosphomannomutase n=1 Tax=Pseudodesulfovibrio cashew TaxID=2678688 RepID=A0A6I6JDE6_9BACT|nr:phosphomannomutase [Pseudodesulfovibrio cashew]QGY39179.1 phosphomannomutase [Pseudodesulfovibrio cashew]
MTACFKTYDVRGVVPEELDANLAERIGRGFCRVTGARNVVVGHDMRLTSPELAKGLIAGLNAGGADTLNIGLCGTEEIYHAAFSGGFDGGVMVTASHNPAEYNGMKFVGREARPLDPATDYRALRDFVGSGETFEASRPGKASEGSLRENFVNDLLEGVDTESLKGLRILVNSGNGCAGPVVDALAERLPCEIIRLHHEPDGTFPNGVPNPLLSEKRQETSEAVVREGCDFGVAFDGDFDRCFLFDENGRFVEGYYIVAMLAEAILAHHPGAKIIHDPRLTWNTIEVVERLGGTPVLTRTGHVFIKQAMREQGAVYGGEMSGHHYYERFGYCDSGMLTWLLVSELLGASGVRLSEKVAAYAARYPVSGEINRRVSDPASILDHLMQEYGEDAGIISRVDGLSMEFPEWRFNLRSSNTEPVVRLNVEARGDAALMREKTDGILALLEDPRYS